MATSQFIFFLTSLDHRRTRWESLVTQLLTLNYNAYCPNRCGVRICLRGRVWTPIGSLSSRGVSTWCAGMSGISGLTASLTSDSGFTVHISEDLRGCHIPLLSGNSVLYVVRAASFRGHRQHIINIWSITILNLITTKRVASE